MLTFRPMSPQTTVTAECKANIKQALVQFKSAPESTSLRSRIARTRCSCSLALMILIVLVHFEVIVVLPLGAVHSSAQSYGFSLADRNVSDQLMMRKRSIETADFLQTNGGLSNKLHLESAMYKSKNVDSLKEISKSTEEVPYYAQDLVIFTFTAAFSERIENFSTALPSRRPHTLFLEHNETVTIHCRASLLGVSEDMDVRWLKDDVFVSKVGANITVRSKLDFGTYRCLADVAVFSMDLLNSYFSKSRRKRTAEMPSGSVLSSPLYVKHIVSLHFVIHPQNVTVVARSVVRLECSTNGTKSEDIIWYRDEMPINDSSTTERLQIYTIEHKSVIHMHGVSVNDSGYYQCVCGKVLSDIAVLTVTDESRENIGKGLMQGLQPETSVSVGQDSILECLDSDPETFVFWNAINELGQPIRKYQTTMNGVSRSALVIREAHTSDSGKYTCVITIHGTVHQTLSTLVTIQAVPILLVPQPVNRIPKELGTTARLKCSASVEPQDTSFRITWYKDGKKIIHYGRRKLQPVDDYSSQIIVNELGISFVEFTKELLISNVQQSDQGLYQCVASNAVGERSIIVGLVLEAVLDDPITDLQVAVDHRDAQFVLKWRLPKQMDFLDVHRSVFLLNYYLTDAGSANNVPLRNVHCSVDKWCTVTCCSSNYVFQARRNYTFQMSLLKMDSVGRITPLSEHVTAISWDGVAIRALDLAIKRVTASSITVLWLEPSADLTNGLLQSYALDYYVDGTVPRNITSLKIPSNTTSVTLTGISSELTYRMRVIPVTRHGLPSNIFLKSNPNYTYIGYNPDITYEKMRSTVGTLHFEISRIGISALAVEWTVNGSVSENDVTNYVALIRYSRSDLVPLREKAEEGIYSSGVLNLSGSFETGCVYQFCSRVFDGVYHGEDVCRIYRLPPRTFSDVFSDLTTGDQLPRPVRCSNEVNDKTECFCETSYEYGDAVRVFWSWPADDFTAEEFVVHYALNEKDADDDDRMVITDESYADLPNLKSNATYRIMVEARNRNGGVEGTWFTCSTPTLKQIPAPSQVSYKELNQSTVRITWEAVHANPHWSTPIGYVIIVQASSGSSASAFTIIVDGIDVTSHDLTILPDTFYKFQIAARSSTEDLGERTSPYYLSARQFNFTDAAAKGNGTPRKQRPFLSKLYIEAFLIGAVAAIAAATVFFGVLCAYMRVKRRKLEHSLNAVSAVNALDSRVLTGNNDYEMEELIDPRTSVICCNVGDAADISARVVRSYSPLSSYANVNVGSVCLDTKGGEQGALPSGREKFVRLLKDEKQLQKLKESGLLCDMVALPSVKKQTTHRKKSIEAERLENSFVSPKRGGVLNSKLVRAACGPSHLWTGSLPSKNRFSRSESSTHHSGAFRHLDKSRLSATSSENGPALPGFLSRLVTLSNVPWRNAASHTEPLNQSVSYASIVCPRSSSVHSNSCQPNGIRKRESAASKKRALAAVANDSQLCCNSPHQSFEEDVAENGCVINMRDSSKGCCTAVSSSLPNLTDSGIVYDELHPPSNHLVS